MDEPTTTPAPAAEATSTPVAAPAAAPVETPTPAAPETPASAPMAPAAPTEPAAAMDQPKKHFGMSMILLVVALVVVIGIIWKFFL